MSLPIVYGIIHTIKPISIIYDHIPYDFIVPAIQFNSSEIACMSKSSYNIESIPIICEDIGVKTVTCTDKSLSRFIMHECTLDSLLKDIIYLESEVICDEQCYVEIHVTDLRLNRSAGPNAIISFYLILLLIAGILGWLNEKFKIK